MNKKWLLLIIIPIILVIIVVAVFLYYRSQASLLNLDINADDNSIAIIGGADGPTAVFIAGKIGDSDIPVEINVEEVKMAQIEIQIGDQTMVASLEGNEATEELVSLLEADEIVMSASNYGGFEKVCSIGQSISRDDEQIATEPGDIMLYNGNQLVIFYDSNSWSYTRIGRIDATQEELEAFLSGDEDEVIIRLVN